MLRSAFALALAFAVGQTGSVSDHADVQGKGSQPKPAQTNYYPGASDGARQLADARASAKSDHRRAVVVFGADWCHDSRALAAVLTSEGFRSEFGGRYAVTFIDVGKPQTGEGRNLELVEQLGVKNLKSTPALLVIAPDGKLLNGSRDAISWRNAESRGSQKILAWFRSLRK